MSFYYVLKRAFQEAENIDTVSFYPQFRLEARARSVDNDDNLAMRTADPLWMLGRQWQFGEFVGEDNGSAITTRANYYRRNTTHVTIGGQRSEIKEMPLEALVEAMPVKIKDLRTSVKIGDQYKRIIRRLHGNDANEMINNLQEKYPLPDDQGLDNASLSFKRLMNGKVINGSQLISDIHEKASLSSESASVVLTEAEKELKAWFSSLYLLSEADPESKTHKTAWRTEHLSHSFQIHAHEDGKDVTLSAPDYQSGHLDWYSFDNAEFPEDFNHDELPEHILAKSKTSSNITPINVSFAGMPHKRLFSFEDHMVDLGSMDIHDDDLIRLMMLDFSLFSGSDWYTIPIEMELGEVCWINHLQVKDVFGVNTKINNGRQEHDGYAGPSLFSDTDQDGKLTGLDVWDVFKIRDQPLDGYQSKDHFLYLPPTSFDRQESEALEELLLLRDEFANMVFGIEKRVRNKLGNTLDGYDLHLELNGPFIPSREEGNTENKAIYRLANTIPFNWIPYIPKPESPGNLRRAMVIRNEPGLQELDEITPLSYLASNDLINLREEAIPKAGVRVQLTNQRIRWTDGKTYLWRGRKVLAGKGEGDSGLRFDYLKEE